MELLDLRGHESQTRQPIVELNDLRSICRSPELLFCDVQVHDDQLLRYVNWLKLGEVNLVRNDRFGTWRLTAYLADATDVEEDSAYALQLGLLDLRLSLAQNSVFYYEAFIHPDPDQMRVPPIGYDPRKWPSAETCKTCSVRHPIVEKYVPEENHLLSARLRGAPVQIMIGTHRNITDENEGACPKHKTGLESRAVSFCPRCEKAKK